MANSTAAVNVDRLAELTLDTLMTKGVPLKAFTTDLTSAVSQRGDVVRTRYAGNPSVVDFSDPANRVAADSDLTDLAVTLDKYQGVGMGFTDLERSYTDYDLIQFHIEPAVAALVDKMIEDTLSLAVVGNVADEQISTAAAFDADAVADLAEGLSSRKVSTAGRAIIIPPSYTNGLLKDSVLISASDNAEGRTPLREGMVRRIHGFDVFEYNGTIPANARNMTGIALQPQALAIAARVVAAPENWNGQVRNITDPNSGLTIQLRHWYDDIQQRTELSVLYGVNADSTTGSKATAIVSA